MKPPQNLGFSTSGHSNSLRNYKKKKSKMDTYSDTRNYCETNVEVRQVALDRINACTSYCWDLSHIG